MTPISKHAAAFVRSRGDGVPVCGLCPHRCAVDVNALGTCKTRQNIDGTVVVTTYGRLAAAGDDPIEKKPLFHFRPGTRTFSVASLGCNLTCPFCQNHSLSTGLDGGPRRGESEVSPEEVVAAAANGGSQTISFTYSEPVLMFEFARDTAAIAHSRGLDIAFVSNGQINEAPARELAGFLNAANIDLKSHSAERYRNVLGGSLKAAKRTIEMLSEAGVWVEVTTLVIPEFNDSDRELAAMAGFIASVNPDIPWHVSRFHGAHKWRRVPSTPPETLDRARQLGLAQGLKYVYTGNLPGGDGENTVCPGCGDAVIERFGYRISKTRLDGARCATCGETIAGVGLP